MGRPIWQRPPESRPGNGLKALSEGGAPRGVLSANRLRISPQKDPGGFGTKFHTVQVAFEISKIIPHDISPQKDPGGFVSKFHTVQVAFEVSKIITLYIWPQQDSRGQKNQRTETSGATIYRGPFQKFRFRRESRVPPQNHQAFFFPQGRCFLGCKCLV